MAYSGTLQERRAKRNVSAKTLRARATKEQREAKAAYMKAWRIANREHVRAGKRAWRAENPEKALGYVRAAWEKYGERYKAAQREQYRIDPSKYKARASERRALQMRAMPEWLTPQQLADIEEWYVLGASLGQEVDHIVPLRGQNVCGLHVGWNLQLLPRSENRRKCNKLTEEAYL